MGIINFEPLGAVGKTVGTRREWRIKQETGELRGVCIREKNKDRKAKGWIDRRSPGWGDILASYETWRRTPRYAVGTFEQPTGNNAEQPTGADIGNVPHA